MLEKNDNALKCSLCGGNLEECEKEEFWLNTVFTISIDLISLDLLNIFDSYLLLLL
jgi:hypothetical protein